MYSIKVNFLKIGSKRLLLVSIKLDIEVIGKILKITLTSAQEIILRHTQLHSNIHR